MQLRSMLVVLATLFALVGSARADLRVVTTTPDLAAIVQAVGAGHVQVSALALSTQDPHFVDARPRDKGFARALGDEVERLRAMLTPR